MILIIDFVGRFHPLLLHLPIGILVYAYLQWCYDIYKKKKAPTDLTFALTLGCISAIFSAISGWALAQQGGYDQGLLNFHQNLGIGSAIGSIILLIMYYLKSSRNLFGLVFTSFIMLLTLTGHYGGSLTHGKDFLTKSKAKPDKNTIPNIEEAHIFNDIVMPIFERKCVSCHNPEKSKGNLLFHNLEGWKKGGKNGNVLSIGHPSQSHLLQRAYLPKEDDEHMPPDGKLQLSIDELNFLEWWIKEMKNYDHLIKDLNPNNKILKYLKSLNGDAFDGIRKVSQSKIRDLSQYGIIANSISANTPWIEASLAKKSGVNSLIKKLNPIAENVIELNLSNTDIKDKDLIQLKKYTNLKKLNLSGCNIGNRGISNLKKLQKLEHLNLYNTKINNESLAYLSNLKSLKKIYLWQTNIDKSEALKWESQNPKIEINLGVDQSIFGTPKLASPIIKGDTELFKDSLLITLQTNNQKAKIFYSLSTSNGLKNYDYKSPFYIQKTSVISAYMQQDGWTNSDTTKKSFIRTKYKPDDITLSSPPNEKYPAEGPTTLIDFTKGSESFGDGKWLGFFETDLTAVIDLGQNQEIESISVGSLRDDRSYIFSPLEISIQLSYDNIDFLPFANKKYEDQKTSQEAQVINHILHGEITNARYIKIGIIGQKYNPKWHAAPGAACWLFLDEIVVE